MDSSNPDPIQALTGSAFIVLAAIGFSAKSILIKLAYAESPQVDAITLMTLRMLMSLPFFLLIALWSRSGEQPEHRPVDWIALPLLGSMGYYLASLLDFKGLEYIPAGMERLILFLYPTIVVLLSALLYRRRIGAAQRWALGLSYAGIVLVFGAEQQTAAPDRWLGAALVFASAVVFAVFMTGSGPLISRLGSKRFTAYSMSIACLVTVAHFLISNPIRQLAVPVNIVGLSLALALVSTVAPAFLMNAGIRRIGADQASIISTVGPVSTLALAYPLLGETLEPKALLGSAMVLGGVMLASLRLRRGPPQHTGRKPTHAR